MRLWDYEVGGGIRVNKEKTHCTERATAVRRERWKNSQLPWAQRKEKL
jgi:hypothetical protein